MFLRPAYAPCSGTTAEAEPQSFALVVCTYATDTYVKLKMIDSIVARATSLCWHLKVASCGRPTVLHTQSALHM